LKEYKTQYNISNLRQPTFVQSKIRIHDPFSFGKLFPTNDLKQLRESVNQLNRHGYIVSNEIRSYKDIEEACEQFQEDTGLKIDGILGPKTQWALRRSSWFGLELFFAPKVTLKNIRAITIINRKREVLLRFYLLFIFSFLSVVLIWPLLISLFSYLYNIGLFLKGDHANLSSFLNSFVDAIQLPSAANFTKINDAPDIAKVATDSAKVATDIAKVAPDIAKVAPDIAKVATDSAKVATDIAKVATDSAKVATGSSILDFLKILPILFIISLLSERAVEILLTYALGWDKNSIFEQIKFYENLATFLSENQNSFIDSRHFPGDFAQQKEYHKYMIPDLLQKIDGLKKVLTKTSSISKNIAYLTSFTIGIISAFSGFRIIEPLLLEIPSNKLQLYTFRWLDIVLTSILVSGGTEIIHRLYKGAIDFSVFTQLVKGGADNVSNTISNLPRLGIGRANSSGNNSGNSK
jgi:hypothetical protein